MQYIVQQYIDKYHCSILQNCVLQYIDIILKYCSAKKFYLIFRVLPRPSLVVVIWFAQFSKTADVYLSRIWAN